MVEVLLETVSKDPKEPEQSILKGVIQILNTELSKLSPQTTEGESK